MNDETSCFEIMNQCHLTLMRNENKVNRQRETCEYNELIDDYQRMEKEMKHLVKMHNGLRVKYRKLMNDHNDVINELANDWKLKVVENTKK